MAEQALEHDLRGESEFLVDYDRVWRDIDDRYDIRGRDLVTILKRCFDQGGRVSAHTRKQFAAIASSEAFDHIETAVKAVLGRTPVAQPLAPQ